MNFKSIICLLTVAWLFVQPGLKAQTTNDATPASAQLQQVISQIKEKASAGKNSEADYSDEFKAFDALIAGEQGAQTDEAAEIIFMKGMLYLQVMKDYVKTAAIFELLATNYPNTKYGQDAAANLPGIMKAANAQKIQATLTVGTEFPSFSTTNFNGSPLPVHPEKGKVLLVDFWATWCGPCMMEMPNVIATYQKHHQEGFDVVGINLDSDAGKLDDFLKKQNTMVWPQYFDGRGWSNNIATKFGVTSIPFSLLIGPNGKIIARQPRGPELEMAVAEAIAMESK